MTQLFGFEIRSPDYSDVSPLGWTTDGIGDQNASNLLETREAAEADLDNLASVLSVDVARLRVSAFERDERGNWAPVR